MSGKMGKIKDTDFSLTKRAIYVCADPSNVRRENFKQFPRKFWSQDANIIRKFLAVLDILK